MLLLVVVVLVVLVVLAVELTVVTAALAVVLAVDVVLVVLVEVLELLSLVLKLELSLSLLVAALVKVTDPIDVSVGAVGRLLHDTINKNSAIRKNARTRFISTVLPLTPLV